MHTGHRFEGGHGVRQSGILFISSPSKDSGLYRPTPHGMRSLLCRVESAVSTLTPARTRERRYAKSRSEPPQRGHSSGNSALKRLPHSRHNARMCERSSGLEKRSGISIGSAPSYISISYISHLICLSFSCLIVERGMRQHRDYTTALARLQA